MIADSRVLALVESNTTGSGRLFCAAARARGLRPIVLTRTPERYPYLAADGIDVVVVDTGEVAAVGAACSALAAGGGLAGVASSSEYFVATAAVVAARLGLPGPDPEAIERCRDKVRQRRALRAGGVPVPRFAPARDAPHAVRVAAEIGYPVVVKPRAGSGSVGVRLCRTPAEVRQGFSAAVENGTGVLVEEFADGPEYSVETLDRVVIVVIAKRLGPAPHFVETGHDLPAPLAATARAELAATALMAITALGLGWGAAHTELRLTRSGPVVVEVNPRLAGGMIPTMITAAGGPDLVDLVMARAAGLPAPTPRPPAGHAAIRFVVAGRDGVVSSIGSVDHIRERPGVRAVEVRAAAGDRVVRAGTFKDRLACVVCAGEDASMAARAADEAACDVTAAIHMDGVRPVTTAG